MEINKLLNWFRKTIHTNRSTIHHCTPFHSMVISVTDQEKLILLKPNPSTSIYPPLFSGQKSDPRRDLSQYQVVYEKEPKTGYCNIGWIFSSDSNSNKFPYQARDSETTKTKRVKKQQLSGFYSVQLNTFLNLIPILNLFLHILLPGVPEVRLIDY